MAYPCRVGIELDWSEADPDRIFRALHGLVVDVDGSDFVVSWTTRTALVVRRWDDAESGAVGEPQQIEWDNIGRIYIY